MDPSPDFTNPLAPTVRQPGLESWIHAAKMSAEAYKGATWKHRMSAAGWPESDFLSLGSSFQIGWVYSGPELGILEFACAGTAGLRDLSLDLWSWFPNWWSHLPPGWWAGYGMVKGPRGAWPKLIEVMRSAVNRPVKEIRWCGHSKGGAEAELCHAACRCAGLMSSCIAIEPPRVFKPFARDQYRMLLEPENCECDVIINTVGGRRDYITAYPRTLEHGGNLNLLGRSKVYSGDDALEKWKEIKRLEHRGRGPIKGRYDAHGLDGVIKHIEDLLELRKGETNAVTA